MRLCAPLVFAFLTCAAPRLARASDEPPDFFVQAPPPRLQLAPPPKSAPEPAPGSAEAVPPDFGSRGQVVVGGGSNVGISETEYSAGIASSLALMFSPTVDYFALRNVSIGLSVDLLYMRGQILAPNAGLSVSHTTTVAAGPRIGVNVPLGRVASLWPRLSFAFESVHHDQGIAASSSGPVAGNSAVSTTLSGPSVGLYVPLVLQVSPHLFAGIGPTIFHSFAPAQGQPDIGGQRTQVSAGFVVGGYFGGIAPATVPGTAPPRRFGQAHQVIVTNEDAVAGSYMSYTGAGASVTSLAATLGVDYFFADHVSVGLMVAGSYARQVVTTPPAITTVGTNLSAGARMGVDLPLSSRLSIYPSAGFSLGPETTTQTSSQGAAENVIVDATLSLSVPLLVHLAGHFFAGFGPYATQDLRRPTPYPNPPATENDATTIGAEMVVGGWL